ncbi:polysaccharide biosynthesis protein [Luteimonas sp. FXH3W]|uniref:UDP-glucose 4-epimerase n=1 Tax=Aquilutibacter rugosus TaxID=3115820 RepID=A0ABU7UYW5_9GAMM
MFRGNVLLITGGTGSFGNAVLRRFLQTDIGEIRLLSRDEKKQDDMRKRYSSDKIKFYIGDVRDPASVMNAMRGVDYVFHAAALKQVPSCEFHPMEAVKTNVIGTENATEAAIQCGVKRMICLSTDKAVYPINAMGISKAMMEKVFVAKSRNVDPAKTTICGTRYGNVMASRGSVIPLFVNQINAGQPITITDPSMTRFMMTLDDAVDLVLYAFEHGNSGDIFVQKAPAATMETLARALTELLNKPDHPIHIIGTRHGEKKHEALMSREEMAHAQDLPGYFRVPPDLRDLNYGKFVEQGERKITEAQDYTSGNTVQLDVEGMKQLLLKLDFIRDLVAGRPSIPLD